jgi:hypothetical protein
MIAIASAPKVAPMKTPSMPMIQQANGQHPLQMSGGRGGTGGSS